MLKFMQETLSVWELLQQTKKPIVLYGMGNGADKIIDWCEANGVQVQGVLPVTSSSADSSSAALR